MEGGREHPASPSLSFSMSAGTLCVVLAPSSLGGPYPMISGIQLLNEACTMFSIEIT